MIGKLGPHPESERVQRMTKHGRYGIAIAEAIGSKRCHDAPLVFQVVALVVAHKLGS